MADETKIDPIKENLQKQRPLFRHRVRYYISVVNPDHPTKERRHERVSGCVDFPNPEFPDVTDKGSALAAAAKHVRNKYTLAEKLYDDRPNVYDYEEIGH